eukprot:3531064-Rhodomonas_salina.4
MLRSTICYVRNGTTLQPNRSVPEMARELRCEIKHEQPQPQDKRYQECGFWYLISGCRPFLLYLELFFFGLPLMLRRDLLRQLRLVPRHALSVPDSA